MTHISVPIVALRGSFARLDCRAVDLGINDAETRESGPGKMRPGRANTRERPSFPNYDELCKGAVRLCSFADFGAPRLRARPA